MTHTITFCALLCAVFLGLRSIPASPADSAAQRQMVRVCVVTNSGFIWAPATFRPREGDTIVLTTRGPVPWRTHYAQTGLYAEGREWFDKDEAITLPWRIHGRGIGESRKVIPAKFRKLTERVLTPDSLGRLGTGLERVGTYDGVPLFGEAGVRYPPEVYYVPVRPGCAVQPYLPVVMY